MKRSRSNSTTAPHPTTRLRLGLCCQFAREPIKFRTTTATAMLRLSRSERLARLAELCLANADALFASLHYCAAQGIGAFRINSQILPIKTHPQAGYDIILTRGTFRMRGSSARSRSKWKRRPRSWPF